MTTVVDVHILGSKCSSVSVDVRSCYRPFICVCVPTQYNSLLCTYPATSLNCINMNPLSNTNIVSFNYNILVELND